MAAMPIQIIDEDGVTPTYAAVADGDTIANQGGDVMLHVKNGGGVASVVTITPVAGASRVIPGLGTMSKVAAGVSIPAGQERMFGPFPAGAFNNSSGNVVVNYSAITTVTAGAFQLPRA